MKRILFFLTVLLMSLGSNAQKVLGGIQTNGTSDTYATHYDSLQKGGFRVVTSVSERNAISNDRRKQGMFVYVVDSLKFYQLKTGISNGDWTELTFAGSGVTTETDPVATAATITFNPGYGLAMVNTPAQTIGVNPVYTPRVDTALIASRARAQAIFDSSFRVAVGSALTYNGGQIDLGGDVINNVDINVNGPGRYHEVNINYGGVFGYSGTGISLGGVGYNEADFARGGFGIFWGQYVDPAAGTTYEMSTRDQNNSRYTGIYHDNTPGRPLQIYEQVGNNGPGAKFMSRLVIDSVGVRMTRNGSAYSEGGQKGVEVRGSGDMYLTNYDTTRNDGAVSATTKVLYMGAGNHVLVGPVSGVAGGGSGTVTSITAGTGLTGGTITTAGTVAVDTTVMATRANRNQLKDSLAALIQPDKNFAENDLTLNGDRTHITDGYDFVLASDAGWDSYIAFLAGGSPGYSIPDLWSYNPSTGQGAQLQMDAGAPFWTAFTPTHTNRIDLLPGVLQQVNVISGDTSFLRNGLDTGFYVFDKRRRFRIGALPSATLGSTDRMLVYDTTSKRVAYAAIPGGGSGTTYAFTQSVTESAGTVTLVNDSTTLTGTKVYSYAAGQRGWHAAAKLDLTDPVEGSLLRFRASDSAWVSFMPINREISWTSGTTNFPGSGDSTYCDSSLAWKHIKVYRDGLRLTKRSSNGYSFNDTTGTVTFHPAFTAAADIVIESYDTTYYKFGTAYHDTTCTASTGGTGGGSGGSGSALVDLGIAAASGSYTESPAHVFSANNIYLRFDKHWASGISEGAFQCEYQNSTNQMCLLMIDLDNNLDDYSNTRYSLWAYGTTGHWETLDAAGGFHDTGIPYNAGDQARIHIVDNGNGTSTITAEIKPSGGAWTVGYTYNLAETNAAFYLKATIGTGGGTRELRFPQASNVTP